jgi:HAD superfamily hydrolase (TIGR01509 family)
MARFDAILTDIDGTLTDSEDVHREGYREINRRLGVNLTEKELEGGVGVALSDKYDELKDRFNRPVSYQEWADMLAAYYVLNSDQVKVLPGVKDTLRKADEAGMAIAAVTNAQRAEAGINIGRLGDHANLVRFTLSVEDFPRPKPAPDGYLMGARRLGVDPSRTLVLEDSPVGVAAAKAAGMTVIQIQKDPALINKNADLIVESLDDPKVAKFLGFDRGLTAAPTAPKMRV